MSCSVINLCGNQRSRYTLTLQGSFNENPCGKIHLFCEKELGLPSEIFYITCCGRTVTKEDHVHSNHVYYAVPRLLGGKGGFGSMLRAIGAQIEKTTSREACRDLSGRRMRDVNNEKQLREWVSKQADREKEKETRRQERLERRRATPNHKFDDPQYEQQKSQVTEQLEDALQTGWSRNAEAGPSHTATKRKAEDEPTTSKKPKSAEWLGIDIDDLSSSDSDSDSDSATPPATSSGDNETHDSDTNITVDKSTDLKSEESEPATQIEGKMDPEEKTVQEGESKLQEKKASLLEMLPPPINNSQNNPVEKGAPEENQELFDLDSVESCQQLMTMGLEILKNELLARGLKCGGSLEQRAERLWAVKGLEPAQYPKGLLAKPAKGKK